MLVAISIPLFTSQLEKSRDAVTVANLRSAYAEASTLVLTDPVSTDDKSGNATKTAANVVIVSNVELPCTDGKAVVGDIPFTIKLGASAAKDATVTFTFQTDGTVNASISTK